MSEMKDFMISSWLLYGHVPGGAIMSFFFYQAFCSLSSHLSALIKGIFVCEWEESAVDTGLLEVMVRSYCCSHLYFVMNNL